MLPTYRIVDWEKHFETYETKRLVYMRWVPVPNKHDGKGFRKLSFMKQAPEIYCAWHLMLQLASKCPVRGVLADSDGPLKPEDMQIKTGFPASIFELAIKPLIQIGWLSCDIEIPADSPQTPADSTGRIEGNGMEGMECILTDSKSKTKTVPVRKDKATAKDNDNGFAQWYAVYPRKTGRGAALRAFTAALKKTDLQTLIRSAEVYAQSRADEDPKFTKHPATWLNGEHWDDQVEASAGMPGAPPRAEPTEEEMRRLFPEWKCHQ